MLETVLCIEYQHFVLEEHIKLVMKKEECIPFSGLALLFPFEPGGFVTENLAKETGLNDAGLFTELVRECCAPSVLDRASGRLASVSDPPLPSPTFGDKLVLASLLSDPTPLVSVDDGLPVDISCDECVFAFGFELLSEA